MSPDQKYFHELMDRAIAYDDAPEDCLEEVWFCCLEIIHEAANRAARLGLSKIVNRARKIQKMATPGQAKAILADCLAALNTPDADTAAVTPTDEKNDLKTVKEASGLLRVGTAKVYALVTKGLIKHVKVGRRICFRPDDLNEYLNRSTQGSPGRLLRF